MTNEVETTMRIFGFTEAEAVDYINTPSYVPTDEEMEQMCEYFDSIAVQEEAVCVCEFCGKTIRSGYYNGSDVQDSYNQHILIRHPEEQ